MVDSSARGVISSMEALNLRLDSQVCCLPLSSFSQYLWKHSLWQCLDVLAIHVSENAGEICHSFATKGNVLILRCRVRV